MNWSTLVGQFDEDEFCPTIEDLKLGCTSTSAGGYFDGSLIYGNTGWDLEGGVFTCQYTYSVRAARGQLVYRCEAVNGTHNGNTLPATGAGATFRCENMVEPNCANPDPVCGDGDVEGTEQCDDGNTNNNDGCSAFCLPESCGDNTQQTNEQCDDGNTTNNDGCSSACEEEVCGDGITQDSEECDDGNVIDTDACTNDCKNAACGDGIIWDGNEECDGADHCNINCVCSNQFESDGNGGCECPAPKIIDPNNPDQCTSCGNNICEPGIVDECSFCTQDCTAAECCGNDRRNTDFGEECDGIDGCTDQCMCEDGRTEVGGECWCELPAPGGGTYASCCEHMDDNGDGTLQDPEEVRLDRTVGESCGGPAVCVWCFGDKGSTCNVGYFPRCADCSDPNTDLDPNNDDPDWERDAACTCSRPNDPNCSGSTTCEPPYAGACDKRCSEANEVGCYTTLDGKRVTRGTYTGKLYCNEPIGDGDATCGMPGSGSVGGGGGNGGTVGNNGGIGGVGIGGATGGGPGPSSPTNSSAGNSSGNSQSGGSQSNQSSSANSSNNSSANSSGNSSANSSGNSSGNSSANSSGNSSVASSGLSSFSFSFSAPSSQASSDNSSEQSSSINSSSQSSSFSSSVSSSLSSSSFSSEIAFDFHYACVDQACTLILEPGEDTCSEDTDCLTTSSAQSSSLSSISSSFSSSLLSSSGISTSSQASSTLDSSATSSAASTTSSAQSSEPSSAQSSTPSSTQNSTDSSILSFQNSSSTSIIITLSLPSSSAQSSTPPNPFFACGNGILDPPELCDDGNRNNNDGCDNDCGLVFAVEDDDFFNFCGNGILDAGEQCDDGNNESNDGCSRNCGVVFVDEDDFIAARCGNNILEPPEQCDDGNRLNGDTCASNCRLPGQPDDDDDQQNQLIANYLASCGNGILDIGEQCDDGNRRSGDGCSNDCGLQYMLALNNCGNGTLDPGEQCDDGNRRANDGCDSTCGLQATFNPPLVAAAAICGNGTLDPSEECDDTNRRDNDGCSSTCLLEVGICGDGKVQSLLGEQCEPNQNLPPNVTCVRCRYVSQSCGDNTIDPGEECDEGPQNSTSPDAACRPDCSLGRCGDGILDSTELCDDGNRLSNDGCDRFCRTEDTPTQIAADITTNQNASAPVNINFNPLQTQQINFPTQPTSQQLPFQLPLAQLQPLMQNQAPVGDTGPAALAVIAAGAAAGWGAVRRRRKK